MGRAGGQRGRPGTCRGACACRRKRSAVREGSTCGAGCRPARKLLPTRKDAVARQGRAGWGGAQTALHSSATAAARKKTLGALASSAFSTNSRLSTPAPLLQLPSPLRGYLWPSKPHSARPPAPPSLTPSPSRLETFCAVCSLLAGCGRVPRTYWLATLSFRWLPSTLPTPFHPASPPQPLIRRRPRSSPPWDALAFSLNSLF